MYCGIADIVARWVYTRQGVHQMTKQPDFPAPAFTINEGRTKVWLLADIKTFEKAHPEVTDEGAKLAKVAGYRRAISKGRPALQPAAGKRGS